MNVNIAPTLSVIIVTYNSSAHLREALDALFLQDHPSFEAILFDNASRDGSLAIAREFESRGLKIIANASNRGFAGGNNDAVAASRGELIVLLNPDAVLESPGALRAIERAFSERPEIGVLGGKLMFPDGRAQHMGIAPGIPAHCTMIGRGDPDSAWPAAVDVESVVGALFAVRRELWERLGGFDEFYNPAYYEDTDFCFRARALGLKVLCDAAVRVTHYENVSTEYHSPQFYWMHHKNRLWYTAKNLPMGELLMKAAPAEVGWFFSAGAKGRRGLLLSLYWMIVKRFVKRRLLGFAPLHEKT